MKRFFIASIVLLTVLSSCTKTPGTVIKDFIGAIQSDDVKKIQALSADDTADIFVTTLGNELVINEVIKEVIKQQIGEDAYTIAKEEINGNTATVTIKTAAAGDELTFDLVKINNEWKVTFKK